MSFKFPTILGSNSLAQRQEEAGSLANFFKDMKGIFILQCNVQQDDGNTHWQLFISTCNSYRCVSLFDGHQTLVQSLGRMVAVDE